MAMEKARPVLPLNTELFTDPYDALVGAEAVLLATEWPLFVNLDWATVKKQMNEPFVIIDGRNALNAHQLISLGYRYEGYGRSIRS
jgi:UDPglucose 6-dehydrogenase